MKEERYLDFGLATTENVPLRLDSSFNNRRPAAALGYKSPVQYKTELGFWGYGVFGVCFFDKCTRPVVMI